MENKDKIYDQFKEAATKAEDKGFARMDAVWNRVEEKLDKKKERRAALWWKYTGIAALFLLFMGIGSYLLNNNDPVLTPKVQPDHGVTVIDTVKVKEVVRPQKTMEVVVGVSQKGKGKSVDNIATPKKSIQEEIIVLRGNEATLTDENGSTISGDSIYFNTTTKKARVWNSRSDVSEFRVKGYRGAPATAISEISAEKIYAKSTNTVNVAEALQNTMPGIVSSKIDKPILFTGIVTDEQGLAIPGVTVTVNGKSIATQTDFDGKYSLQAIIGDTLNMSFIGMKEQSIVANINNNWRNIAMMSNSAELSEVVVEGYRSTTRAQSNVAVTTVTSKTIESRPNATNMQSLQGRITGVPIQQNNSIAFGNAGSKSKEEFKSIKNYNGIHDTQHGYLSDSKKVGVDDQLNKSTVIAGRPNANFVQSLQGEAQGLNITTGAGAPGSNNKISIRGVSSLQTGNDPLYVIDGVVANARAARKIDANNIESISVLKNANAISLYGNRGINGVVIITTKKLTRKQIRELKRAIKEDKEAGYIDNTTGQFVPIEKIKIDEEEYESFEENKFENPATTPLSTFSIDVDNASYTNIRRFINNGQTVPKDAVRVEEMINFFKYSYPQPSGNDTFSINTEYSDAPWNTKHKLLKIGLQGMEIATKDLPASNFVFLIDVSGSMNDANKLPLLKQSMKILVNQMRPKDRIAIVVYAGAAGLVLPSTSIADKDKINAALDNLNAGGSTAGGAGIELAYKTAQDNFIKGGNNRVILATDGDFNVGASTDDDMQTLIESKRKSGVLLTCLGYGMGNYKDSKLETLADKGNGNYAYIDNMQEADRFLNKEFKGSMYAIAKDVKIQIEFNPKHVQSYRLIGYENRKLRDEDFTNDTVDAGELGSGHTVTALYEIIPTGVQSNYFTPSTDLNYSQVQAATGNYNDELATIKFRHKKPDEDKSTEIIKTIPNSIVSVEKTSLDFKFAAAVAWFGLKLRDSKLIPVKSSKAINELAKQGLLYDPEGYRAEFIRLVEMVE